MSPEITTEELEEIKEYHRSRLNDFKAVQNAVRALIELYRRGDGNKHIRFVLDREAVSNEPVKTVDSVVTKILRNRTQLLKDGKDPQTFGMGDVEDWIGVKILCPFPTDVQRVIQWLLYSNSFAAVEPSNTEILKKVQEETEFSSVPYPEQVYEAALRDRERKKAARGYLAWHFMVLAPGNRPFSEHRCEVQIKTLLEEGWDAKTHDVSYKRLGVKDELRAQMKILSRALEAADEQSETVKVLIEEEETRHERRRQAAISQYLFSLQSPGSEEEVLWAGIQPDKALTRQDVSKIEESLERRKRNPTGPVCHSAALLAMLTDRPTLEVRALDCANSFVSGEQKSRDANRFAAALKVRAITSWALGDTKKALADLEQALGCNPTDTTLVESIKSLYAYYVAEVEDQDRREIAFRYLDDLGDRASAKDTRGLLHVVFGQSEEEVEKGRQLLSEAIREARAHYRDSPKTLAYCEAFHKHHDYVALKRLLSFHG